MLGCDTATPGEKVKGNAFTQEEEADLSSDGSDVLHGVEFIAFFHVPLYTVQ